MIFPIQAFVHGILERLQFYIQKYSPIYILHPHNWGIGNTTEEILFGLLHARKTGKKILFLWRFNFRNMPIVCNKELFRLESPYILSGLPNAIGRTIGNTILTVCTGHFSAFLSFIFGNMKSIFSQLLNTPLKKPYYIPYKQFFFYQAIGVEGIWIPEVNGKLANSFSWDLADKIHWEKELLQPFLLKTNDKKAAVAKKNLEQMGIRSSDWYVCLHVREGGFKGDHGDIRNCNIKNYFAAVRAITDAGGWVIRMGDRSMTPLPSMSRVIDYPFTKFKSEFMDLFLVENCRFFFGQNSGIVSLAILLNKRCVLVNMTEWVTCSPKAKNSLMIFKHYYSEKMGRYLSLQELLVEPFDCQDLGFFNSAGKLVENSSEEILALVQEALSQDEEYKYTDLQTQFIERRKCQIREWINHLPHYPTPRDDLFMKYRLYSHIENVYSTFGRKFIEDNWNWNHLNDLRIINAK